ncbi:MAG: hypothetical protein RLY93_01005 [Sumerlaeia bacterium]
MPFRILTLLILLGLLGAANVAPAQTVPPLINYQGRLTDDQGQPVSGNRAMSFSIYQQASGGTAVWGPQDFPEVPVTNGVFNVILSSDGGGDPVTDAFDSPDAFLGLRVGPVGGTLGAEFSPRQQFLSVPYSIRALDSQTSGNDELLARLAALEASVFPPGSAEAQATFLGTGSYRPEDLEVNANGDVYIIGTVSGAVDLGDGPFTGTGTTGFVCKYSGSDFSLIWKKLYNENSSDFATPRALDFADNGDLVLVVNYTNSINFDSGQSITSTGQSDVFVTRLSPSDGSTIWFQNFGSSNSDSPSDVAVQGNNIYIVGGFRSQTLSFGDVTVVNQGGNSNEAFIVRLPADTGMPSGGNSWGRNLGGNEDESFQYVGVAPNGNVIALGLHETDFFIGATLIDHPGNDDFGSPNDRMFLASFNGSTGNPIWGVGLGDAANLSGGGSIRRRGDDICNGLAIDSNGDFVITGNFDYPRDFGGGTVVTESEFNNQLLAKYRGSDGSHVWSFAQSKLNDECGLTMDGEGNPIWGGYLINNTVINLGGPNLDRDYFYAKFSADEGEHLWSVTYDGPRVDPAIMSYGNGRLFVTGWFTVTLDLGVSPVTATAGTSGNMFIARLRP